MTPIDPAINQATPLALSLSKDGSVDRLSTGSTRTAKGCRVHDLFVRISFDPATAKSVDVLASLPLRANLEIHGAQGAA